MSRILVIGGYGGFGGRLSRRLARRGHRLLVGGRSAGKAAAFARVLPDAEGLAVDRLGDLAPLLARHRPDLVIDAAGPFAGSDYRVPKACIAAGIPYLDLADGRGFVCGIGTLDPAARAAGVAVIAGASTAPALTGAIARALAEGMDRVDRVDIALSVANRAAGGDAVVDTALNYTGRPLRLLRGRRWADACGFQELKRADFLFSDGTGLGGRLVALADVADCELLAETLPGCPAVTFSAGTELGFQMLALWALSWPVRWRWLKSLAGLRRWVLPFYRLSGRLGGERSAMSVVLAGEAAGERIERRWTIVAERGQGLEIPTLTAELLAADVLAGKIPPGARDAASLMRLDDYAPLFAELPVRIETRERRLPPPLYARVLGERRASLPAAVRGLHDLGGDPGAVGEGTVLRGRSPLARLIGAVMRFPPEGSWPLLVAFAERNGTELWTRDFGGHCFTSELSGSGDRLVERFGPLRFYFDVPCGPEGLEMRLSRWTAFQVPLPLSLAPRIAAREWEEEGEFRFDVGVSMPLAGEVVRYRGALSPAPLPFPPKEKRNG